ncbi:hypothetical protein ACKF11_01405 [Methylobacillus sp. Pita2]
MKTTFRVLVLSSFLAMTSLAGNAAPAAEMCSSELQHAVPVQMNKGAMLSVSDRSLSSQQNALQDKQALGKPRGFERYQRPVLVDKGICHQKSGAFNKSTVKM